MPVLMSVFASLASALQRPTHTHFRLTSDLEGLAPPSCIRGHCALRNHVSNVKKNWADLNTFSQLTATFEGLTC